MAANQSNHLALKARGVTGKGGLKSAIVAASKLTSDGRDIRKNDDGLTPSQAEFALAVASGMTLADAYRSAYNAENMRPTSIYTAASLLMDRPAVAQRVKQVLDDRYAKSLFHNVKHVRQHVLDRLMAESVDMKSPPSARIQAVVWLGKVDFVGMFKENTEDLKPDRRKAEDIEQEIRQRLAKLLGGQVIENKGQD